MTNVARINFPPRLLALGMGEVLIIGASLTLAMVVRLRSNLLLELQYQGGFLRIAAVCATCILCLYFYDLYDPRIFASSHELVGRIPQVIGTAAIALALLYAVYPPLGVEPQVFLLGLPLLVLGLVVARMLFIWYCQVSPFAQNVIILGHGSLARDLAREISNRPELGFRFAGYVGEFGKESLPEATDQSIQSVQSEVLGTSAQLVPLVAESDIRHVIVALEERRGRLPVDELLKLKARGVTVGDGVDFYESISGRIWLESLNPGALVFGKGFSVSALSQGLMRLISVMVAVCGLILSAPLMLVIAVLIKLDSPGPVFFRQPRVGKDGRHFTLYKFRSMFVGSETPGIPKPAVDGDERFTRVGRRLRRTRLDELPQLCNILKGDMTIVGPRPFVPAEEDVNVRQIPYYSLRWSARPGVTGWAQVQRGYCATVEDNIDKLSYDLFYLKNISVGLDLFILFKTLKILLLGRGSR